MKFICKLFGHMYTDWWQSVVEDTRWFRKCVICNHLDMEDRE